MTPTTLCLSCGTALPKERSGNVCPACLLRVALQPEFTAEQQSAAPREALGSMIGRYKLLQEIGEGGFGIVYMAEQTEPVKRMVALKVLKPGMDTREVVARFEAERQALAMMDHPNIARVHDGGTTDSGRPYFVMELVKGVPLTTYCDNAQLTTRERLDLFLDVLAAVQHAHLKGIIHRDLKPSNILVSPHDGHPVIKVIDFGIAKALSMELTSRTLFTGFGQMIGTPQYTSPEQAELNAFDVDTRSDIYSLGVVLYELLTGNTPLDAQKLRQAGYAEMQRLIREDEPPKPSTRISNLGQSLPDIARHRAAEPLKLAKQLRGDLDWIVMKALEKDRKRRYETANGFAADLRRHLADEPVTACPPSVGYRLRKLVRRNRAFAASATAIALTIFCALGLSLWLYSRERIANQEQFRLRKESEQVSEDRRRSLVRTAVANANGLIERGDSPAALPWLLKALEAEAGHPTEERIQRMRIGAVIENSPRLVHMWQLPKMMSGPAVFSPDGSKIAVPCEDKRARLWSVADGKLIAELPHQHNVIKVVFSPDGKLLATASWDGTIALWQADNGRPVGKPMSFENGLNTVAFSPGGDRLIGGDSSGAVRIWNVSDQRPLVNLIGHTARVQQVGFSPDGLKAITIAIDRTLRVWNAADGKEIQRVGGHDEYKMGFCFRQDGDLLATFGWTITRLLDREGKVLTTLRSHTEPITAFSFSPDGRLLATASEDATVQLILPDSGLAFNPPTFRHPQMVNDVAFSPDPHANTFATACADGCVRIFTATREAKPPLVMRHSAGVQFLSFSPDGSRLVTSCRDQCVRVWELPRKSQRTISLPPVNAQRPVVNSEFVALATRDGAMLLDPTKGEILPFVHPPGPAYAVYSDIMGKQLAFVLDNRNLAVFSTASRQPVVSMKGSLRIAAVGFCEAAQEWRAVCDARPTTKAEAGRPAGSFSRVLTRWKASDGTLLGSVTLADATYNANRKSKCHVGFNPDATRVIAETDWGRVQVFDAETGQPIGQPLQAEGKEGIQAITMSPDGRSALVFIGTYSTSTGIMKAICLADATVSNAFAITPHKFLTACFSPDSRRVATGSFDGTVRVYDVRTMEAIGSPMKHSGTVCDLEFDVDGRLLVSASNDCTVRIWDSSDGEPVTAPLRHATWVRDAMFTSDGEHVLTYTGTYGLEPAKGNVSSLFPAGPDNRPLATLHRISELLSCSRLRDDNSLVTLTAEESARNWRDVATTVGSSRTKPLEESAKPVGSRLAKEDIPERPKEATEAQIDLSEFYNGSFKRGWLPTNEWTRKEDKFLERLEPGLRPLGGVTFDVRGVIQLRGSDLFDSLEFPVQVTGINIGAKATKLHFLQACAWDDDKGGTMGSYVIHYADDSIVEIPLTSGINIRDWNRNPANIYEAPPTDASEVWKDTNTFVRSKPGSYVRLYLFTWNNPKPSIEILSIDMKSTKIRPAPFLMAITRE